jgi:hypothetical protein
MKERTYFYCPYIPEFFKKQCECAHDWDNSIGIALTNPPQPMRRCKKCKKTEYYSYDGQWR